jgi:hypothetical protein
MERVPVRNDSVRGKVLDRAIAFHKENGLLLETRSIFKNDTWFDVYCFAQRQNAESFRALFGGDLTVAF